MFRRDYHQVNQVYLTKNALNLDPRFSESSFIVKTRLYDHVFDSLIQNLISVFNVLALRCLSRIEILAYDSTLTTQLKNKQSKVLKFPDLNSAVLNVVP